LQLQLLDLPLPLFRASPELHPPQLGDQQLQAFDLRLSPCQLFLLGVQLRTLCLDFCRLHGQRLLLREDQRAQGFRL
jgi:hypothetical protein